MYNNGSSFFTTPNEREKKAPNVLTAEPTDLTRRVLFDETPEENYIEIGDNYGIVKKGMTSDEFTDEAGNTSIFEEMGAIDETQNDVVDETQDEYVADDEDVNEPVNTIENKEGEAVIKQDSPEGKAEPNSDYVPTPDVKKKKVRGPDKAPRRRKNKNNLIVDEEDDRDAEDIFLN